MKTTFAIAPIIPDLDNPRCGYFQILSPLGRRLKIIASDGKGWDHVSVSLVDQPTKTPTWDEMCFVKALFWNADEVVVQFHPAQDEYVNYHRGTLHLWRSQTETQPVPPRILVGPVPDPTDKELALMKKYQ